MAACATTSTSAVSRAFVFRERERRHTRARVTETHTHASRTHRQYIMDGATDAGATNASRLYVGNIPWSTTVEDLRDLFADCGGVRDVDIPTGRQGRSRGYGIVEFATEADALAAVSRMDGTSGFGSLADRDRGSSMNE